MLPLPAFLGVDPVAMFKYYVSMPLYLIVILLITGFNLDKSLLAKMSKS